MSPLPPSPQHPNMAEPHKSSKSDEFLSLGGGAVMKIAAVPFWIGLKVGLAIAGFHIRPTPMTK